MLTHRSATPPREVPARRRLPAVLAAGLVLGLGTPAAAAVSAPTDGPDVAAVTVAGTIEQVFVDVEHADGAAAGDHPHPAVDEIVEFLQVDRAVYELPDGVADGLVQGTEVEVTLEASSPDLSGALADAPAEEALEGLATGEVVVEDLVTIAPPAADAVPSETAAVVGAGPHTLTVLPVHWAGTAPAGQSQLVNLAAAAADYWSQQSAGRIVIRPDVRAAVAIPAPRGCDPDHLMSAALAANPSVASATSTSHVMVHFPYSGACQWAGQASIGGGTIWVNGALALDVTAHELGHNLGLGHADTAECTNGGVRVPLSDSCTRQDYRDYADVMGIARSDRPTGSLNSAFADYLGLAQVRRADAVPTVVDLAPLGQVSGVRAVVIPIRPGVDVYVDYRPAVGRDTRWGSWAGVQVHLRTLEGGRPRTELLDMQPAAGAFVTPQLPATSAGWVIPGTGKTLRLTSVDAVRARVEVVATSSPLVEAYVRHVYSDLFGRTPDAQGMQSWVAALAAGTPRVAVANGITSSYEYRARLISGSYQRYLGRGADPSGMSGWQQGMAAGYTVARMESGFVASPEYYSRAGSTDAGWVRALYRDVLGRSASTAEVVAWTDALRGGGSRSGVALGFLLSSEHLGTVVDGHYQTLLRRGVDPVGRAGWVNILQAGGRDEAIVGGIVASEEYFQRR